jgi:hypothetical protein
MTLLVKWPRDEDEDSHPEHWFTDWFSRRNSNKNVNDVLVSGDRGSGKSRGTAAFIEYFDRTFTPSLKNHPV